MCASPLGDRIFKWLLLLGAVIASGGAILAQTPVLRLLQNAGPSANRVNLVVLGDGYVASEQEKFFADAQQKIDLFTKNEAFAPFKTMINGYAVFTASNESGTDIPAQGIARDTYYDTGFPGSINDRLLYVTTAAGNSRVLSVLLATVPEYDIVLLLVNTTVYGGAGGFPAVGSLSPYSDEVLLHETGHSFAHLADEYVDEASAPFYSPQESINATQKTDRGSIPWQAFLLDSTPVPTISSSSDPNYVGLWEGAYFRAVGFYRPTYNSKMRNLGQPFGPVNLRAFADALNHLNLNNASARPSVTAAPQSQSAGPGDSVTLSVAAGGTGPFTYQWIFNGKFLAGQTQPTLTVSNVGAMNSGEYAVTISNGAGNITTAPAIVGLALPGIPVITTQPESRTVPPGASVTFAIAVSGSDPFIYQWRKDGVILGDQNADTLTLSGVQVEAAGSYTVTVSNSIGTVISAAAMLNIGNVRLVNIATRAFCGGSNRVTIGGFVISGSASKRVLVRAVGPSLTAQGIGGSEVLLDPTIEVHDASHGNSVIATNDDWGDNANAAEITSTAATIGANALLGSDTKSSALLLALAPGVYSFVVNGKASTSGIVLLEVYDADSAGPGSNFVNIATRAYSTTGNGVTIGGFVITGNAPKHVLLRAVGPTLTKRGIDMSEVLTDPVIELHDASHGNVVIATNDDWGDNANAPSIVTTGARIGAMPLDAADTKSSALLYTLQPGVYSFIASGKSSASGIVLVEVYDAD
jgi:hypothetical protein